jgi:hypothetical protein
MMLGLWRTGLCRFSSGAPSDASRVENLLKTCLYRGRNQENIFKSDTYRKQRIMLIHSIARQAAWED